MFNHFSPENPESHEARLELFSERLKLKDQWESQVKALNETGVLDLLPESQDIGIIGIDGKEYSIPKYNEILSRITPEKLELLETKLNQGFSRLLLVPLAMPLSVLIDRYKRELIKHSKEGTLLSTDGTKLDLDPDNPIYVWGEYQKADIEGKLVYYPERFDNNHGGNTKQELIDQGNAWEIQLVENTIDIPAEGRGQTLVGRKQLEANQSPNEYLKLSQQDPQYQNEQGLTFESWLVKAITHLHQTNQQINDFQGKGKICYLLGSLVIPWLFVPGGYFRRDDRQAYLDRNNPDKQSSNYGAVLSVKI